MRIAFDGTTLQPGRTGVGYYTEHLLRHLIAHGDHEVIVLANRPIETTTPLPDRVRVEMSRWRPPRMVWMQTEAVRALRALDADVAHFTNGMIPPGSRVPMVVTIHDMSLTLYPRYHPLRRVLLNRPLVDRAARRADAVISVSDSARRDIVRLYGLAPERVHVVHEAAAPVFQPVRDPARIARVRQRYDLADRVILYVGTVEPRKNLPRLIEAFAAERQRGALPHQLVCAGPYGWLSRGVARQIADLRLDDAVRFTGYVPFDDLAALYSTAEMFVFPSLYEGFGLPLIEAMACGVPVIAGRNSSLGEIAGGAIEHVETLEPSALGRAMVRLAHDPDRRAHLAASGLARAQMFSWDRAARETLGVYHEAVARARRAARRSPVRRPEPATVPATAVAPTPAIAAAVAGPAPAPRVLFGQAYFLRFDPKLWEAQQAYAPLGTLYAAAAARARGYHVDLFDAMLASSEAEWTRALDAHRPDVAVLYEDSFNYLSKMCLLRMRQAALTMIAAARARGVPTIVAGSDATDHPDIYLDGGAGAVIVGEGEVTLVECLDALTGRSPRMLSAVEGLALRDPSGAIRRTPARGTVRDLDSLPFPAWDLVDVERYRRMWLRRRGFFSMNLVTTRGCPYHCNWCAKPIYGQRYAVRSAARVVDEMAWLKAAYRPDHLWMADDLFGLKPGWIEELASLVAAHDAAVPFKCLLRADQVTPAVADALHRSHCRTVWIGAESGSQRILDAMEKGVTVDQIVQAARRLHEAAIEVGLFVQFGYPGETREDIERTLQLVRDCRPDDIGISVSYPLPGTPFYDRVKAQLGEKRNWVDSDDLAMMYRATYAPGFYRTLHALVHAEFRARKSADVWARSGGAARPATRLRHGAAYMYHAGRVPVLRRRLTRLARLTAAEPPAVPVPTLTRRAAAVPSEPSR